MSSLPSTRVMVSDGPWDITDPDWPTYQAPDVTTGLALRWTADALTALADGASITSWPSTGPETLTLGSKGTTPQWPTLKRDALGEHSAAQFDSACIGTPVNSSAPTILAAGEEATIVMVTKATTTITVDHRLLTTSGYPDPDKYRGLRGMSTGAVAVFDPSGALYSSAGSIAGTWAVIVASTSASGTILAINDTVNQSATPITGELRGLRLGAAAGTEPGPASFYPGLIAETRIYRRALTLADVQGLITQLRYTYGI